LSELPENRTKRNIVKVMEKYQPSYQITFVFESNSDAEGAHEAFKMLRKKLSAQFPEITLIWWLRTYLFNGSLVPMFQIFSTDKLDHALIDKVITRINLHVEISYRQRRFSEGLLVRWCSAIKNQKLHNIKRYFGETKVRRWAVTNKSAYKEQAESYPVIF